MATTGFHLLALRFSSLGDMALHSSLFRSLKERWAHHLKISLLTSKEFAPLIEGTPYIDHVYAFDRKKGLGPLIDKVRSINEHNSIGLLVDLHGSLRSLALRAYFWRIPRVCVDKRTVERLLLTKAKVNTLPEELLLERIPRDFAPIFQLRPQDLKGTPQGRLSFCSQTFDGSEVDLKKWGLVAPFIAVIPGASFEGKRWPIKSFVAVVEKALKDVALSAFQFLVLAGPEDHFCDEFNHLVQAYPQRLVNLQGQTSLKESLLLVKAAHLCMGNDTGMIHFAESVDTPVLSLLGPTGEQFGFTPHLPQSQTLSLSLWCRPCTTNGKGRCIRSERFCLTRLTPDNGL